MAISRKLAFFRDDSTDFELRVRGNFTDSCETRLGPGWVADIKGPSGLGGVLTVAAERPGPL